MRNVLMALVAVGFLAGPSPGVINVRLTADNQMMLPGQTTTIRIWAQGTVSGIYAFAGDIIASGTPGVLTSNPGSFVWVPKFSPTFGLYPRPGTPGSNGGWTNFGSEYADYLTPEPTYGQADYVQLASYTVTWGPAPYGPVTLTFAGKSVSGYRPVETDKTSVMGVNIPATLMIVPEPVTLALLALGGLVVARRRR